MFWSFLESEFRLPSALPNASRRLGSRFPNSESCPFLQQTLLPRSGAAERREDPTPYWSVLSQGCGLRIPSLGYGEFLLRVVEGGA